VSTDSSNAEGAAGERVATVGGYRLCEACGFQLHGVEVRREPTYGLLITRCPECGHVHPASDPPSLARKRVAGARLAGVLWLGLKLGIVVGAGALLLGLMIDVSARSLGAYEAAIEVKWTQAMEELIDRVGEERALTQVGLNRSVPGRIGPTWWDEEVAASVLQESGGFWSAIRWRAVDAMLQALLVAGPGSVAIALVLPHVRTRRLVLFAPLIAGLAALGAMLIASRTGPSTVTGVWGVTAILAAMGHIGYWVAAAYCLAATGVLAVTLLVARPLARGIVRAMLRPELRDPFQDLWLADGLDLPRARVGLGRVGMGAIGGSAARTADPLDGE